MVLDRAFRRRSRGCRRCNFSLPYGLPDSNAWSIDPAEHDKLKQDARTRILEYQQKRAQI